MSDSDLPRVSLLQVLSLLVPMISLSYVRNDEWLLN